MNTREIKCVARRDACPRSSPPRPGQSSPWTWHSEPPLPLVLVHPSQILLSPASTSPLSTWELHVVRSLSLALLPLDSSLGSPSTVKNPGPALPVFSKPLHPHHHTRRAAHHVHPRAIPPTANTVPSVSSSLDLYPYLTRVSVPFITHFTLSLISSRSSKQRVPHV